MYDDPDKFLAIVLITSVLTYLYSLVFVFLFKNFDGTDRALGRIQSVHKNSTPRLGGVALILAIISVELIFGGVFRIWFFWALSPIFLVGLVEDFHLETNPTFRLFIGAISSLLAIYLSNSWIKTIDVPIVDMILQISLFGIVFTLFASVGMINAINLIDGIHGLAAAMTVLISLGIFLIASSVGEEGIAAMGALVAAGSLGLFFVSFPYGRIFMGDAGAYTLGFIIAWQMIVLLDRHPELSAWSLLAVVFWPVMDTLFSIFRRMRRGKPTNKPDLLHFHQLVMRSWEVISRRRISRNVSNPLATATILPLSVLPIILGIKYSHSVKAGIAIVCFSVVLYLSAYYGCFLVVKIKKFRDKLSGISEPIWIRFAKSEANSSR